MEIHQWLREKRREKGYTQKWVSLQLHITRQGLSNWENGRSYPSYEMLYKLICLYGCSAKEISDCLQEKEKQRTRIHHFFFKIPIVIDSFQLQMFLI